MVRLFGSVSKLLIEVLGGRVLPDIGQFVISAFGRIETLASNRRLERIQRCKLAPRIGTSLDATRIASPLNGRSCMRDSPRCFSKAITG